MINSFKNWLFERIENSIATAPLTYPQDAVCGVLYGAGFDSTKITPKLNRRAESINIKTNALIMIAVPFSQAVQKTGQGAQGLVVTERYVELDTFWIADFSGNINNGTAATYATQEESDVVWDELLKAVEKTVMLAVYKRFGPNIEDVQAVNWPLTEGFDKSSIKAEEPLIELYYNNVERAENNIDLIYSAKLICKFKQVYNPLGV